MEIRMSNEEAGKLARITKEQFTPFVLSENLLIKAIHTAKMKSDSGKMQWKLSKSDQFRQHGLNDDSFLLRRIIANYDTDYFPNWAIRFARKVEKAFVQEKDKGFDSQYVCRCLRENVRTSRLLTESGSLGKDYSAMGVYSYVFRQADGEGRIAGDGMEAGIRVRVPVFIVPGVTEEGRRVLDEFSREYQIPSLQKIEIMLGQTD